MNRSHLAGALAATVGLLHWSCCGCSDKATGPTVVATPTPTPAPTATPTTCNIRPTLPDSFRCAAEPPPRFQAIVIAAQDQVRREHPEIFDGNGRVSQTIYTGWVARTLIANGHCAIGGTDDEVSIKTPGSNEFSELYDLVTGSGDVWNNYIFTCRPSLF
jgi:hypothetical protein